MVVEFATADSGHLNADPRTKQLEMGKVGADPKIHLEQGFLCGGVNQAVVQVYQL